jgi:hypothetical protein
VLLIIVVGTWREKDRCRRPWRLKPDDRDGWRLSGIAKGVVGHFEWRIVDWSRDIRRRYGSCALQSFGRLPFEKTAQGSQC